jgi:gliding motility-associated-like protein
MKNIVLFLFFFIAIFRLSAQSDGCSTATPITIPGSGNICSNYTSAGGTPDNYTTTCNNNASSNYVWFQFVTTGTQNTVTVTPGTLQNASVVYDATGCNDGVIDFCNSGTGSNAVTITQTNPVGTTIIIGVSSANLVDGTFQLCITSQTPVNTAAGDECINAIPICSNNASINFTSTSQFTGSANKPSCFTGPGSNPSQDLWITFTAVTSGTVHWMGDPHTNNTEFDWAMYNSTAGCPGTQIACNYNFASQTGANFGMNATGGGEFSAAITVTAGQTYTIRINNWSNNGNGFLFTFGGGTASIAPTLNFTINPSTVVCATSTTVNISNSSTGVPTWTFGNGNTYTGTTPPSQTYTTPGTYPITATIGGACPVTLTRYVRLYGPISATPVITPPSCGTCNGQIQLTNVTGGDGTFSYSWSTSPTQTTPTASNLCSGTYSVTINDGVCPPTTLSGLVVPTSTLPIISGVLSACVGSTSALSGSPAPHPTTPWTSSNTAVATVNNSGVVTAVSAGTSIITYRDVNGCTQTATFTVTPQNTIAAGTSQTVCINSPITTINLATTGATGATFSGLPAGVTGSWAGNVATISGTPTVAGTFNYTVTTTGGCPPATATGTITVTPLNTIAAGTNQTVCINTAITSINLATTGATGATFTGLPTGVTGTWAGNVVTISGTPTVSGIFNYTVTTTGGCPPATATGTITVTPQSTIAAGTNQTVCINTAITTINLATTGATGATFTGLPAGVTGTWASNVATISGTPTASGTFNYTVTTTGGCPPAATATGTITVTPQNTIAAGTSQTVCINTAITTINLATTTATGATFTGLPTGVTGSWAGNVVTISGTPTVAGTFNYTVTTTGGCPPATTTGTITVTSLSTIAAGTNQTVCINTAITTINLATTGATGATFTGLPAGVTGTWAGNVATISGTPTVAGTFNYTVTTAGGCLPAGTATGTITVTPQNTIVSGTSQTVCINTAISTINLATTTATGATFFGLPAGVTGTWTGNVATISGTPTVAGTFNYTVTTTGGCPPATTTGTITVTPQNTIAVGTSETVCINNAITTINLATTGATGATFTNLPAGVTGTWAGNVATISGTPTASGTFNYTVTTTGGCPPATTTGTIVVNPTTAPITAFSYTTPVCINASNPTPTLAPGFTTGGTFSSTSGLTINASTGEINLSASAVGTYDVTYFYPATSCGPESTSVFEITINPLPTITLSSSGASTNQTVCINTAIASIDYTIGGGATGATTLGLPSGLSGNLVGNTYTISGTPTVSGTFNYTVTTTGGCTPAATATGTITITPQNTIAAGTNQTVCINSAITTINLATTGATGATFTGLPAGVTGAWAGNVATISGTPTLAGTFNYTVTTTGGCPPATATGTITVTPQNTIEAGTSETVCINSAITTINLATTTATGATFTGLPAGVTGAWAGNVATISGTPTASGTFNYTVTTTGGCPPATATGTITVTPQNTIAAGTNQTVCINTAISTINLATTGATGANFTGLPAGVTGTWAGNAVTISGTPTVAGTFNYTVTTTGGCPPAETTGTITVTPQNTIAAGTSQTVCQNTPITTINLATTGATGATFTGLPAGVTGSWAGNVATISGTPTVAGTFNYTVTTTGGCPQAETTGTITVTPQNTIVAGVSEAICINTSITTINLATTGATGATFSGLPAGVTGTWAGNVATISGTPTASGTFNYTVTTTGGCPPATTTGTITVHQLPNVSAGSDQSICAGQTVTLSGSGAATYVWDNGVVNGVPFVQNANQQTYTVVGTDINGCQNQDQVTVSIVSATVPSFTISETVSCETPFQVVFQNTTVGNTANCVWDFGNGQIGNNCDGGIAVYSSVGCYDVTLSVTYTNGCTSSFTNNSAICISPSPTAAFVANPSISDVEVPISFINYSQGAISYVWNFGDGSGQTGLTNPSHTYTDGGTYVVTLVAINEFGCTDTTAQAVLINNPLLFYVPNTFTPDGNLYNGVFVPVMTAGFDPWDYELLIFNRWGEIVFESRHPKKGWDGTYGGINCPDGTYVWQIKVLNASEVYEVHRGHVHLLR